VIEPEGVSLSLSHYCPTAADLLFDGTRAFSLVTNAPAFPGTWPFEGLDATGTYPPLLRPGVLLGLDGLRAFEEEAVRVLATGDLWSSVGAIESAVAEVRSWTAARGPLPPLIRSAFRAAYAPSRAEAGDPRRLLMSSLSEGTPPGERLPVFISPAPPVPPAVDLPLRKYLASRLFGAWITYQGDDLRTTARYLRLCLDTVRLFAAGTGSGAPPLSSWKEAVRKADLWLLHYCDLERLARNLR
jgi:hypothetical protein